MDTSGEAFPPLQADDPVVVGGYRLAARLGAGGMGRVYLSHTRGGRPVAIKVVRSELADDPAFRRRFRREIAAARRVRGAYTAELIDADPESEPPWLATLYVPGPSLADAVAERGPLPVPAVLRLMAGVAEALQAIHEAGIVHRDLKPSNVLLATDGPRVIDFGVSQATDATSFTATGAAMGTPVFMAPEQASGSTITPATDVFALGQTAAFAALGEPLYGDGPLPAVLYRIVHSAPDLSLLPEELRPLFARCLAADPTERATVADIVQWCAERVDQEGPDGGAGSFAWREIRGSELTVPAPLAPSTGLLPPTATHWPYAPPPAEPMSARARVALVAGALAAVTSLALLGGLAWSALGSVGSHGTTAAGSQRLGSGASGTGAGATGSVSGPGSGSGSVGDAVEAPPRPSPTAPATPLPIAEPLQSLDATNSLDLGDQDVRKDRKGDIRFTCGAQKCSLESRSSVLLLRYAKPGATYDSCKFEVRDATSHSLPLAAVAAGSEICARDRAGNIALLVVQVKSTAMPDVGFLMTDVTVWPHA
ncbi:serine/threonine protein kinase [Streptomyces sp. BK022]|uniref:serine/threonine-protein kinase n=1 Tax=Streptomyces sp. BK022 TaxID=2512123 RepID=UPI00102955C8|nr:serine/threonine-protein kinase [Streptomyces sp. BK022]RZU34652.1 serine/threonine protein kinase [Streptomyces sp. BK022]